MKIERLRVAELRQFREPFELAGLQPGLNIIAGPNEAGKSTLVRAIRAAFFERHRSTSVDDLRPYGDTAATPSVEIDFALDGTAYRLHKRFLQKKRCELWAGDRQFDGVEAEDHLARLLGFQFAAKGVSREEHWGIPGLLWVEQGGAQSVRSAVAHAADHLRQALDESLGEVAASGGDEVVAQVRKLRDELLTGTGKPRAAYQKAIDDAEALDRQVQALQRRVDTYREQVDQLARLRSAHASDGAAQPWVGLREQQQRAQQALQAVDALAGERDRTLETLRQVSGLHELLLQRLEAAEQQQQALQSREAAVAHASHQHEQAALQLASLSDAERLASERLRAAQQALDQARQEGNRQALTRQLHDARTRAGELAALLLRARTEHDKASTLQREAMRLQIDPDELATLRRQQRRLHELEIRQAAVATRLRFTLEAGVSARLDGQPLGGDGERLLVTPATLQIDGVGRLQIAPGGGDLAELADEQARLQGEQRLLLQRLGLDSAAEADSRERTHAQRKADADAAAKARELLAPQGLDALQTLLDAALARQAEATQALDRLPAALGAATPPLQTAESAHAASRKAADDASQWLQRAHQAQIALASQLDAARRERDAIQAALSDPRLQAELVAKRLEAVAVRAQMLALQAAAEDIQRRIAAARPEILRQDVERLQRSADEVLNQHQAREHQILKLTSALEAAGAQGLEEELARAAGDSAQADRRREQLQRRAEALELLLQRLEARRQALTRRLQAPLQAHLDRYLPLVFPAGRLAVDEGLVPGLLTRPGSRGPEAGDFETLSFGAREQMGLISRLAYADLLKAAGRPTLLILDDVLVNSDEERRAMMKRVLFDAAQRHQLLLFTCHPTWWRDMGVPLRSLERA